MELQLNEKDLQALLTADEIHKHIFMERDHARRKLEEAEKILSDKERELRANVQNSKMLEWNISEFDGEVKRANS